MRRSGVDEGTGSRTVVPMTENRAVTAMVQGTGHLGKARAELELARGIIHNLEGPADRVRSLETALGELADAERALREASA